jgi:protein crumbs
MRHELIVTVMKGGLTIALNVPKQNKIEAKIVVDLLDNHWHTIQFIYRMGNLNLIIDRNSYVIANSTYNREFLTDQDIKNEAAVLILGKQYSGCLLHGPGLIFNNTEISVEGVLFGSCPLAPGQCNPEHDVLMREPVDHCMNFPCMHGQCISRTDEYECHCPARFGGKNCDKDLGPPCEKNPCRHGGTCEEDRIGNYKCLCSSDYTGKYCESLVEKHSLCEKNPCLNNGTCSVSLSSNTGKMNVECQCLEGFTGDFCEINIDDCKSQPCQNNGLCIDLLNGYTCDCSGTGYSGQLCQKNINECSHNPCQNGGICYDNYGSYTCECKSGFGGVNCEQIADECQSNPCLYGGTCVQTEKGNVKCICGKGFTGQFCEFPPQCSPSCPRDSQCIDGHCICKQGMTGKFFFFLPSLHIKLLYFCKKNSVAVAVASIISRFL